ncbi:MAG TPA: sigma-70 family RNA polymerase sigma factor, partial [Blastococcus sp.]
MPVAENSVAPDGWVAPTWEQVVREHSARVYRLAYRLSGNAQDAEDLTQETFIRVFRSLADFSPGTFEGWLHRITTNLFLDMVRRRQRIRFDALPEDTERLPGTAPSEGWVAPSWEQVVREHSARVYRLAYRLSGNAQDAEDLTQ